MSLVEIRKQMAQQAAQERHLECRTCRTPTAYETLSSYGGLCGSCYGRYCREQTPGIKGELPQGMAKEHPRAWAHRLKDRDDSGELLTPPQREMYREALRRGE